MNIDIRHAQRQDLAAIHAMFVSSHVIRGRCSCHIIRLNMSKNALSQVMAPLSSLPVSKIWF